MLLYHAEAFSLPGFLAAAFAKVEPAHSGESSAAPEGNKHWPANATQMWPHTLALAGGIH